jgi:hypothetical protein
VSRESARNLDHGTEFGKKGALVALTFRSLRRDWLSWSRMERATAIGILLSTPASVACALGAGFVA